MIAVLDFDGTLIKNNIGLAIMRTFSTNPALTETLINEHDPACFADNVQRSWQLVDATPFDIRAYAKNIYEPFAHRVEIDLFLAELRARGYDPIVVSNGIECYIKQFINTQLVCTPSIYTDKWFTWPSLSMKARIVDTLNPQLYFGDSKQTDLLPARIVQDYKGRVFSPVGSTLSQALSTTTYCNLTDAVQQL